MLKNLLSRPRMNRRLIVLGLSTFSAGACTALFDQIGFGTSPCALMNLGISRALGWSYGTWFLTMNVILLLILLALGEIRRIGLGSVTNMVLVGYSADFTAWLINQIHPLTGETLLVRLLVFIPTMALFLISIAMYMVVDLGVAPYDALPQVIAARQKKVSFSFVRICWDVSAIIIGFALGQTVGLVTVVVGFCMGPVYSALANRFRRFFQ